MQPVEIGFRPTIGTAIRRAAAEFGDDDYVVTPDDRLTYAAAESASARLARRMLSRGIGKGTRVGLFFPNGVDFVVAWLAASRIGAVVVPFSTLYAPGEVAKVLRLGDIDVLLAPARTGRTEVAELLERALPTLATWEVPQLALPQVPYLRRIWIDGEHGRPWAESVHLYDDPAPTDVGPDLLEAVEAQVTPADPVIILHTSGSTADPKGVVHSHGTLLRQSAMIPPTIRQMSPPGLAARYLCAMPMFWIAGVLNISGALHAPVTILAMAGTDPGAALELLERERGTLVVGWPTFTQKLRQHPDFHRRDLTSIPSLHSGPSDLALIGVEGGVPRHRAMTESAGSFVTTEIRIVGADGHPVPTGDPGELWIRGPGIMLGYNKREDWEVFDADGWFHTGDRVFQRENDPGIYFAGRYTELIKTSGANVSPKEVEVAVDEHPDVQHCFVIGLPDDLVGEAVVAVVVPIDPAGFDGDKVAGDLRTQLSAYKIPRRWIVVDEARLPVLASGKPDKRRLIAMAAAGEIG